MTPVPENLLFSLEGTPYALLIDMVNRVCDFTQTPRLDIVGVDLGRNPSEVYGALLRDNRTAIFFAPGSPLFFTEAELYAVITHEVGHLRYGHLTDRHLDHVREAALVDPSFGAARVCWEAEFQADDLVKQAGMVPAFKSALFKVAKMYRGIAFDSPTHPGIVRRIQRLEK